MRLFFPSLSFLFISEIKQKYMKTQIYIMYVNEYRKRGKKNTNKNIRIKIRIKYE